MTEHPDAERLRAIGIGRTSRIDGSLSNVLNQWVDVDTLKAHAETHLERLRSRIENKPLGEVFLLIYAEAFLTGAQFQLDGGHREVVPDGQ